MTKPAPWTQLTPSIKTLGTLELVQVQLSPTLLAPGEIPSLARDRIILDTIRAAPNNLEAINTAVKDLTFPRFSISRFDGRPTIAVSPSKTVIIARDLPIINENGSSFFAGLGYRIYSFTAQQTMIVQRPAVNYTITAQTPIFLTGAGPAYVLSNTLTMLILADGSLSFFNPVATGNEPGGFVVITPINYPIFSGVPEPTRPGSFSSFSIQPGNF